MIIEVSSFSKSISYDGVAIPYLYGDASSDTLFAYCHSPFGNLDLFIPNLLSEVLIPLDPITEDNALRWVVSLPNEDTVRVGYFHGSISAGLELPLPDLLAGREPETVLSFDPLDLLDPPSDLRPTARMTWDDFRRNLPTDPNFYQEWERVLQTPEDLYQLSLG